MKSLARTILAVAAMGFGVVGTANAAPATYTFSGTGGGDLFDATGAETTFADTAFTFVFTADTTAIDRSGSPFFRLNNIGGTFTEGSFTATLTPTVTIVSSADPGLELINFFNATFDNGLGMHDPALNGYDLSFSIGPLAFDGTLPLGDFLTPTFGGGGFATTDGGKVQMTSDTSLTFTAVVVPEPASLAVFGIGLVGLGMFRRRKAGKTD